MRRAVKAADRATSAARGRIGGVPRQSQRGAPRCMPFAIATMAWRSGHPALAQRARRLLRIATVQAIRGCRRSRCADEENIRFLANAKGVEPAYYRGLLILDRPRQAAIRRRAPGRRRVRFITDGDVAGVIHTPILPHRLDIYVGHRRGRQKLIGFGVAAMKRLVKCSAGSCATPRKAVARAKMGIKVSSQEVRDTRPSSAIACLPQPELPAAALLDGDASLKTS